MAFCSLGVEVERQKAIPDFRMLAMKILIGSIVCLENMTDTLLIPPELVSENANLVVG